MIQKNKLGMKMFFIFMILLLALTSCAPLQAIGLVKPKPNIIVFFTDDLDTPLMPYMKYTNELITQQGATFTNYFVTTPLCCPSRASMFRGQYAHNTKIMENAPGFPNFFRNGREAETVAVWLNRAGYQTSLIGKYLNAYPATSGSRKYIPPGWTDWHVFLQHSNANDEGGYYYDYTLSENGELNYYGFQPEDYNTDVYLGKALEFIDRSVEQRDPFFLLLSLTAPHGPSIPAPRHEGLLSNITYPQKPSFLTEDVTPKPQVVLDYATVPGEEFEVYDADSFFKKRAETLLSVDEMVLAIVQDLEEKGQLDNTYIIFTSDNGFHMGEHNFSGGKSLPYTEDILVPFMMRGPGITPGTTITQFTANIDIAPTLVDIANGKTADFVDGRSLMPLFDPETASTSEWRNGLLTEAGYADRKSVVVIFRGIRTATYLYVEYDDGTIEYYDLVTDPYETNNIASQLDESTLTNLHSTLEQLKSCKAETCRTLENSLP